MNIILVSSRLQKARTVTISGPQMAGLAAAVLVSLFVLAGALNYLLFRFAVEFRHPAVLSLVSEVSREARERDQSYLKENLSAMAVRLGAMQAQLLRLDSLGERVARLAGFKPQEFLFDQPPARGGAPATLPDQLLSLGEFGRYLDVLSRQVDDRTDKLGILDSVLTIDQARKKLLPSVLPIDGFGYTSNFGWRLDPFTGQNAFHEGIDFIAESGTAIKAAAGGVVVFAGWHAQYGNMVEVDHGNEIITRYAHASKLLVRQGDVVLRGAKIAEVGATGRATGSHLHFEVRQNGAPQDPARFLRLAG
jgi:murein DD-endopeptidase MepM/ murein hydrolase activator NlpD